MWKSPKALMSALLWEELRYKPIRQSNETWTLAEFLKIQIRAAWVTNQCRYERVAYWINKILNWQKHIWHNKNHLDVWMNWIDSLPLFQCHSTVLCLCGATGWGCIQPLAHCSVCLFICCCYNGSGWQVRLKRVWASSRRQTLKLASSLMLWPTCNMSLY